jgi:hypothetical protein
VLIQRLNHASRLKTSEKVEWCWLSTNRCRFRSSALDLVRISMTLFFRLHLHLCREDRSCVLLSTTGLRSASAKARRRISTYGINAFTMENVGTFTQLSDVFKKLIFAKTHQAPFRWRNLQFSLSIDRTCMQITIEIPPANSIHAER